MSRRRLRHGSSDPDHEDEIRHHIEVKTAFLVAQGRDPESARREAERSFGNVQRIRGELRRVDRWAARSARLRELLTAVVADCRYAVRGARRAPAFTLAVVSTIGLGIGSATTVFAVVDALLLRPLPYEEASRLVELNHGPWQRGGYTPGMPSDRIDRWRTAFSPAVDRWITWSVGTVNHVDAETSEALRVVAVSPGADSILGIPLAMGRGLLAEDAAVGAPAVAVVTRGFYERLGGDPGVLGRVVRTEAGPITVVGVLAGGTRFPDRGGDVDLWVPLGEDHTMLDRSLPSVSGFWGRLRPGVERAAAQERADDLAVALQSDDPRTDGWGVVLEPVGSHRLAADEKQVVRTLAATVFALFLIACVNGVNLLIVRAGARRREVAVRRSIGATRTRLGGLFLVEGVLLGVSGAALGLTLAVGSMTLVRRIIPWTVSYSSPFDLVVTVRAAVFAVGLGGLVAVALGVVPTVEAMRGRGLATLAARGGGAPPARRRLRTGLVIGQVALSMTLLAIAGVFLRSFVTLVGVDPGYDYRSVAVASIDLSGPRYAEPRTRAAFLDELEGRLEAVPGVEGVAYSTGVRFRSGVTLEAEGEPVRSDQPFRVPSALVAPDYLAVTGMQLVAGRGFTEADVSAGGAIVDRDMAAFLWGDRTPLGRRFRLDPESSEWMTVVGVVREMRLIGRDDREGPYQMLLPSDPEAVRGWVQVAVRVGGDPRLALPVIRDAVREIDPDQPIWRLRTAADALDEHDELLRFAVTLVGMLAGIAVLLASVGLYGVLSYSVSLRRRELGVRLALGAGRRSVRRMVVGEGLLIATTGIALGIVGALAAGRSMERLLFEVTPHDPQAMVGTALLFLFVGWLAALVPARRATAVDPAEALRAE